MPIHGYPGNIVTANPTAPTVDSASGVWTTEQALQNIANWPMPLQQISRSLRFNSADSAYLNRTPASAGNRKTWTWSGWVKRSALGIQVIFGVGDVNTGTTFGGLYFNTDDTLVFYSPSSGGYSVTTQVFRDPSAWYHIVCGYDTPNSIVKLYVNGLEITAYSTRTNPSANVDGNVNAAVLHTIGRNASTSQYYLNGYLTEINFIDGLALDPSYFGFFDANGIWQPRAYKGAYGTNGFYLNFSDNSSTTNLGLDYSGNGNNWTPNNFSVTAGAGNDSLVDTPTPYGADTGVGGEVRGNYCTLNPLNVGGGTLSNGNLDWTISSSTGLLALGTMAFDIADTTNKYYWEFTMVSGGSVVFGIGPSSLRGSDTGRAGSYSYYSSDGNKYSGTSPSAYGASFTNGDVIGVAVGAGKITFYKNGVSQGDAFTGLTGVFVPLIGEVTVTANANFGQRPFAYTAPSGFKALCTQNLPEPTIKDGGDYFNTVLYTGDGTGDKAITGVGFQPDFVWVKSRSDASSHRLSDVVRGSNGALFSNLTNAETVNAANGYINSFDSDGFSTVAGATNNSNYNNTSISYVAWNWKANGAGVSNTAGTITSTVSANTDSGFSIVTWTASGTTTDTVGHGLGVTPKVVLIKGRSTTTDWYWMTDVIDGSADFLKLNTTAAKGDTTFSKTSTTFQSWVGGTGTWVAYCFAAIPGYSAFGSYTGNGSTDGPMIFTNFRPRYVLTKRTDSTAAWYVHDTARNTYNVCNLALSPDLADAEVSANNNMDILSNGFKIRNSGAWINASGGTYIYMAFAENPFKISRAR